MPLLPNEIYAAQHGGYWGAKFPLHGHGHAPSAGLLLLHFSSKSAPGHSFRAVLGSWCCMSGHQAAIERCTCPMDSVRSCQFTSERGIVPGPWLKEVSDSRPSWHHLVGSSVWVWSCVVAACNPPRRTCGLQQLQCLA